MGAATGRVAATAMFFGFFLQKHSQGAGFFLQKHSQGAGGEIGAGKAPEREGGGFARAGG